MNSSEKLKSIKAGENYPSSVTITEVVKGKIFKVKFILQSYVCGMYCAIYFGAQTIPDQTGDHNNKSLVTKLKRDIAKAIKRGATVEIGTIVDIKS